MAAKNSNSTNRPLDFVATRNLAEEKSALNQNVRDVTDHGLSLESPPPAPESSTADPKSLPPAAPRKEVASPPVASQSHTANASMAGRALLRRIFKLRPRDHNTSWMASLAANGLLLLFMAMIIWQDDQLSGNVLWISPADDLGTIGVDDLMAITQASGADEPSERTFSSDIDLLQLPPISLDPASLDELKNPHLHNDFSPIEPTIDRSVRAWFVPGGGLQGRDPATRAGVGKPHGANEQSEAGVEMGLAWIAAHQRPSGAWRFQHDEGICAGRCRNPGTIASTTGATGLTLLAYLGAGYTHEKGKYQEVVNRGFYYLTKRMIITEHGGDLQEGTMYAQGIATVALCEAYAMTGDESLGAFAQKGLDFIIYAQNKRTGGWRYLPGQPGDTIVLGWQLMALRSGAMAGLNVSRDAVYRADRFLNRVQSGGGAFYGYQSTVRQPTATAVGLLSRMVTGWKKDRPELVRGIEYLVKRGPSQNDLYYNYYASQVLHHAGVPEWKSWNRRMQKRLLSTQARSGHERGSWYFAGGHCQAAGRLYYTAMAVMTLEVYYRYMPLYTDDAVSNGS